MKLKKLKNDFSPKENDILNWPIPVLLNEHKLIRESKSNLSSALRKFIKLRIQYLIKEGIISDYDLLPFINLDYSKIAIIGPVNTSQDEWVSNFGMKIFGMNNRFKLIREESDFDRKEFDVVVDITKSKTKSLDKK
jgi:hypothetical protein